MFVSRRLGAHPDSVHWSELGKRLRRAGVTTILANYGPMAASLAPFCRANGIRLVAHFHGFDAHRRSTIVEHGEGYLRELSDAAAIIAVSDHMHRALIELGLPAGRIHVIRCSPDESRFSGAQRSPDRPTFVSVGRFVDKKAPHLTLLAFSRVVASLPDARLIMAGFGPLREATRSLALAIGLEDHVQFEDVVSPARVVELLGTSTAFVQHSVTPASGVEAGDSEGTPLSIQEAMLAGTAIISTRHAGIAEILEDGVTGLLVNEYDVGGMARAMLLVAKDHRLRQKLGTAARQQALARFTASHYIASLGDLLGV